MKKKILILFGTRPEAIKLAPVIKELEKEKRKFKVEICITGQHRHMLDQVLETFRIKPDFDLQIMRKDQTLFDINVRILRGLENLLEKAISTLVYLNECPQEIIEYLFGKIEGRELLDKRTLSILLTRRKYHWDEKNRDYKHDRL